MTGYSRYIALVTILIIKVLLNVNQPVGLRENTGALNSTEMLELKYYDFPDYSEVHRQWVEMEAEE
jgi:hypothetical protein